MSAFIFCLDTFICQKQSGPKTSNIFPFFIILVNPVLANAAVIIWLGSGSLWKSEKRKKRQRWFHFPICSVVCNPNDAPTRCIAILCKIPPLRYCMRFCAFLHKFLDPRKAHNTCLRCRKSRLGINVRGPQIVSAVIRKIWIRGDYPHEPPTTNSANSLAVDRGKSISRIENPCTTPFSLGLKNIRHRVFSKFTKDLFHATFGCWICVCRYCNKRVQEIPLVGQSRYSLRVLRGSFADRVLHTILSIRRIFFLNACSPFTIGFPVLMKRFRKLMDPRY